VIFGHEFGGGLLDATTFSKNRDRLLEHEVAARFFDAVVAKANDLKLLSDEHFTVDGTLIEAWTGMKSFKAKQSAASSSPPDDPGNPTIDFHGERRSNQTHQSTTDKEARLMRKGSGRKLSCAFWACTDGKPIWIVY
jgi:hypothetical protein